MLSAAVILAMSALQTYGFPEHGLSSSIGSDQAYTANKWHPLNGWMTTSSQIAGQFIRVITLNDAKSTVKVQKPGIYFVSFHMLLGNMLGKAVTAAVVINSDISKGFPISSSVKVNRSSTVGAAGFIQLTAQDTITIYAHSDDPFTVKKHTAFSIRFHGHPASVIGFLFQLPDTYMYDTDTSQTVTLGPWINNIYGQFYSSRGFHENQFEFVVPVDGTYMVIFNIIITFFDKTDDIFVDFRSGKLLISQLKIVVMPITTTTVNLNEILNLIGGSKISIKVSTHGSRINIAKFSTLSVLLVKRIDEKLNGFHSYLDDNFVISDMTDEYTRIEKWKPNVTNNIDFQEKRTSTLVDEKSFNTRSTAMYYVTADISFILHTRKDLFTEFSVSFYKDFDVVFSKKILVTKHQGRINNDGLSVQKFRISMTGVFELSNSYPLAVAIKGDNITRFIVLKDSMFSAVETSLTFPGVHDILNGVMNVGNQERNIVRKWLSGANYVQGLYDFTKSLSLVSGHYTATEDGVFLVTANVVVSDVDDSRITSWIVQNEDDPVLNGIYFKEGNPTQKISLNLGGLFKLKRGDNVMLFVQADEDQDWKVLKTGFTSSYMGLNLVGFQSGLNQNFIVDRDQHIILNEWQSTGNSHLKDGKFLVPYDGVYFTIATIVLNKAFSLKPGSFFKVYIAIDGNEVEGLYSKRDTSNIQIPTSRQSYTMFISGTFYAKKDNLVSINVDTGATVSYEVLQESKWGVMQLQTTPLTSGALASLQRSTHFRTSSNEWEHAGRWTFKDNNNDGKFELRNTLSFDDSLYVHVNQEGVYLISVNLELHSNVANQLYKVVIVINDEDEEDIGMMAWQTSHWKKQTLHLCGSLFLRMSDKVAIKVSFDDFEKSYVSSPSGFSIVLLPGTESSTSFLATLKENILIGISKQALTDWSFPGLLSTYSFNLETGTVNINHGGYFRVSLRLQFDKSTGVLAKGVTVYLNENENNLKTVTQPFVGNKAILEINELFEFFAGTVITVCAKSIYDSSELQALFASFNITGNTTEMNPYDQLDVQLELTQSLLSFLYIPEFATSRGWYGNTFIEKNFTLLNEYFSMNTWSLPTDPLSNGKGGYSVTKNGVYFLYSKMNLDRINGTVNFRFKSSSQVLCSSTIKCHGPCSSMLFMSCFAQLEINAAVSIQLQLVDNPVNVLQSSERIVNLISEKGAGFEFSLVDSEHLSSSTEWFALGRWTVNKTFFGLFAKQFEHYMGEMVVLSPGTYKVAANILIKQEQNMESALIMLGLFVDGTLQSNIFKQVYSESLQEIFTVNLDGIIDVKKWTKFQLKMRTSVRVTILSDSMWGAVIINNAPYSKASDKGPVMITELVPKKITSYIVGVPSEWECVAFGEGNITYHWYKDEKLLLTGTNKLKIAGNITDTGVYKCVADLHGTLASTNDMTVDIFDIDECALGNDTCSVNAVCENTQGSYTCACNAGFSGDGHTCTDTNECLNQDACPKYATCYDLPGSYNCVCNDGWEGTDPFANCTDLNECSEVNFPHTICHQNLADCLNTPGGYNCSCKEGWLGNGVNCTDEDECKTGNFKCDPNAHCVNYNGTYNCTCNQGYKGSGLVCENVNECLPEYAELRRNESKCVSNAECLDTTPGYTCVCSHGFYGNGTVKCEDINECDNTNQCNAWADCDNTIGGYKCTCRTGYQGNGIQCSDVNECLGKNECENGNCSNTNGLYMCKCFDGYRVNGLTCVVATSGLPKTDAVIGECEQDSTSFKCLCKDPTKRENNILCNGLFVALIILVIVALVVSIFVFKYMKSRKLMKIGPVKMHREKYIEMENESEL